MDISYSSFYRLLTSANDIYQEMQRRSHLPSSEYWVMFAVYQDEILYAHEICTSFFMSRQTVSLAVKKLSQRGWITVMPSSENRREKEIHTTEEGMDFAKKYIFPLGKVEEKAWTQLSSEEREALISASARFQSLFSKEMEALFKENSDK